MLGYMDIGTHIEIVKGRDAGETGRVVRVCSLIGWLFVTLDKHAKDRVYRDLEHGPLIEYELRVTQPGRDPGLEPGSRGFESLHADHTGI